MASDKPPEKSTPSSAVGTLVQGTLNLFAWPFSKLTSLFTPATPDTENTPQGEPEPKTHTKRENESNSKKTTPEEGVTKKEVIYVDLRPNEKEGKEIPRELTIRARRDPNWDRVQDVVDQGEDEVSQ